jgi:hypothetical protein
MCRDRSLGERKARGASPGLSSYCIAKSAVSITCASLLSKLRVSSLRQQGLLGGRRESKDLTGISYNPLLDLSC